MCWKIYCYFFCLYFEWFDLRSLFDFRLFDLFLRRFLFFKFFVFLNFSFWILKWRWNIFSLLFFEVSQKFIEATFYFWNSVCQLADLIVFWYKFDIKAVKNFVFSNSDFDFKGNDKIVVNVDEIRGILFVEQTLDPFVEFLQSWKEFFSWLRYVLIWIETSDVFIAMLLIDQF